MDSLRTSSVISKVTKRGMKGYCACGIDYMQLIAAIFVLCDAIEADLGFICMHVRCNAVGRFFDIRAWSVASDYEQLLV